MTDHPASDEKPDAPSRRDPGGRPSGESARSSSSAPKRAPRVVPYDPHVHYPQLEFLFRALGPADTSRISIDLRPRVEGEIHPPVEHETETGLDIIDANSRCWVYLHRKTGKPVGIIGCYQTVQDQHEAMWGDWLATDETAQMLTIVVSLLRCLWRHLERTGPYRYFRLWTAAPETPRERAAHALYRKVGMENYRRFRSLDPAYPYEIWFYQVELARLRRYAGGRS